MQIKNRGLEKYGPAAQLRILVAKAEKREREEGKETLFFNIGSQIGPGKLELSREERQLKEADSASHSVGV
jgi:hypothetical protein